MPSRALSNPSESFPKQWPNKLLNLRQIQGKFVVRSGSRDRAPINLCLLYYARPCLAWGWAGHPRAIPPSRIVSLSEYCIEANVTVTKKRKERKKRSSSWLHATMYSGASMYAPLSAVEKASSPFGDVACMHGAGRRSTPLWRSPMRSGRRTAADAEAFSWAAAACWSKIQQRGGKEKKNASGIQLAVPTVTAYVY